MITGKIEDLKHYYSVCPEFEKVYEFVKEYFASPKADGSYELIPDKLNANIATYMTGAAETKQLEAHRRYADVQIVLKGAERIDWAHISACTDEISEEFSKGGDIGFYADPKYVGVKKDKKILKLESCNIDIDIKYKKSIDDIKMRWYSYTCP